MISIRILQRHEAHVLRNVVPDVFDHALDSRWCDEFFADTRHHLVVALDHDQVVGMASAVHYVHPDKAPELWINEVGVAPDYQRQGIGQQLLKRLLEHGKDLGCREAWVLTEEDNRAARKLYASVSGQEQTRPVYVSFDLDR